MIRTGMVLEINNNKAAILTNDGQFFKVWAKKNSPSIGAVYSGQVIQQNTYLRFASLAASIFLLVFLGAFTGFYFTPVTTVEVNINPSIELKGNIFNRIIKTTPLNQDGEQILKSTNLKNKTIDDGLSMIIEESKDQNFINEDYISSGRTINVVIKGKKDSEVKLDNFYEKVEKEGLHVNIKSSEDKSNKGNIKIKVKKESHNEIELKPKKEKDKPKKDNDLKINKKNDKEKNNENKLKDDKQDKKDKIKEKNLDKSNKNKNTFKSIDNKRENKPSKNKEKNENKKIITINNDSNNHKDKYTTNKGNASTSNDSNGSIPDKGKKNQKYITKDKDDDSDQNDDSNKTDNGKNEHSNKVDNSNKNNHKNSKNNKQTDKKENPKDSKDDSENKKSSSNPKRGKPDKDKD